MGWLKDVSPSLVDFRIEFRKDANRGGFGNDGTAPTLPDRLVTLHVDPLAPEWLQRNGFPMESQSFKLITDLPEEFSDAVRGDRFVNVSTGQVLIAQARPTVAPCSDFPLAEIMVADETQMGRR